MLEMSMNLIVGSFNHCWYEALEYPQLWYQYLENVFRLEVKC